jgi:dephospho-CoA kinase
VVRVLVTGMSGTGKSAVLGQLRLRGHRVVDTDDDGWAQDVAAGAAGVERLWREDRMSELLAEHDEGFLFVAGCVRNQGLFYDRFDAVVLLRAPTEVMLARIAARTSNPFGKSAHERQRILGDLESVEPVLRRTATAEVSTDRPEVVDLS